MQPLAENLKLIDREMIAAYLDMLFKYVEPAEYAGMLRGIGEGGTEQEGLFRENVTFQINATSTGAMSAINKSVDRWGKNHVASFIVPAAMDKSIFDDGKGTEDRVKLFTTVLVDLDKGDTDGALAWLTKYIGEPTMEVLSGGITETGQFKRHIYWALKEPTAEVAKVALVRGMIASKVGGDPSFKRIAQVVRIPGTVYAKGGVAKTCTIDKHRAHVEMELSDLVERANDMPLCGSGQYAPQPKPSLLGWGEPVRGQAVSFAGFAGQEPAQPVGKQLVETVRAGGLDGYTRWDRFNEVAGHYIHCARVGQMTIDEATANIRGWAETKMIDKWKDFKLDYEISVMVNRDKKEKGEFAAADRGRAPGGNTQDILKTFDVAGRWKLERITSGEKPTRRFIVPGIVQCEKAHILVADGGAGKTQQAADLLLKCAAYDGTPLPGGDPLMWWGERITEHCMGKNFVMVTSEDDEEEMHIRMKELDEYDLIKRAGKRLHIVPLVDVGGAFHFVTKNKHGEPEPSRKLTQLLTEIEAIGNIGAVVVDTLTSTLHGDDNLSYVAQEYLNALIPPICRQMRASLIITHHTRKIDPKNPIKTLDQMNDALRGTSAWRAGVRGVIGFWHASDYEKRLKGLGEPVAPRKCFMGGIVKCNGGDFHNGMKLLVKDKWGIFHDRTAAENLAKISTVAERGWIVATVRRAALDRHPFTLTGRKSLFSRRGVLPEAIAKITRARATELIDALVADGSLVTAEMKKPSGSVLDVPSGPAAKGQGYGDPGAWKRPDWAGYRLTAGGTVTWPEGSPEVAWAKNTNNQW